MKRYRLDFARPASMAPLTLVLLLLGGIGTASSLWQRERLLEDLQSVTAARLQLDRSLRKARLPAPAAVKGGVKAEAALRSVGEELQRPWEGMLDALQAALAPDLRVTRIQSASAGLAWRISGQADSSEAFLGFVQRLRRDPRWAAVSPLNEEPLPAGQGGGKPWGFEVSLQWRADE